MTPPPSPTAAAAVESAHAKLTARELGALRAHLRRELVAELAAKPVKAPRVRETPEVAQAARRMIRAVAARAGSDVEGLTELARLRDDVDVELRQAVQQLRSGEGLAFGAGYSWGDIGRVLGMTRQAAQQRFGR